MQMESTDTSLNLLDPRFRGDEWIGVVGSIFVKQARDYQSNCLILGHH
jgi:hypothetical protein